MVNPEKRTNKAIIFENMPRIREWLSLGYRIPSIHKLLKVEGTITCGLDNFRLHYYTFKREHEALQPAVPNQMEAPPPTVSTKTEPPAIAKPAAAEFVGNTNPKKNESENNEPEQKKTESAFIGASDLEMQMELARMTFAENRNKQKRRRRK